MRTARSLPVGGRLCLITAALIVGGITGSQSQDIIVDQYSGNVRVGLLGGAFLPDNVSFSGRGLAPIPFSGSGKIAIDRGSAVGGFIGYTVNRYVNVDGILGYSSAGLSHFKGTLDLGPLGKVSGKFPLKGSTDIFVGYANLMIDPLGISEFTPYFGAGPGFAVPWTETQSLSLNGTSLPIRSRSSELKFAANILVGADYRVSEKLDVGIAYQRFWIDTGGIFSATISGKRGSITGQIVGALFEYHL